jgi:hypothetical protein
MRVARRACQSRSGKEDGRQCGRGRDARSPGAPRTDPSERLSRTGLLPRVKRTGAPMAMGGRFAGGGETGHRALPCGSTSGTCVGCGGTTPGTTVAGPDGGSWTASGSSGALRSTGCVPVSPNRARGPCRGIRPEVVDERTDARRTLAVVQKAMTPRWGRYAADGSYDSPSLRSRVCAGRADRSSPRRSPTDAGSSC